MTTPTPMPCPFCKEGNRFEIGAETVTLVPTAMTWQPMETAPKDGTEVLLRMLFYRVSLPDELLVDIGSWRDTTDDEDQMWRGSEGEPLECDRIYTTGWMPLPKP